MDWEPIPEAAIWDLINEAELRMSISQARLWEAIRLTPHKWNEKSYGAAGNGFWVVAIMGSTVIWYNDIEDGFNLSSYSNFGTIDEYWCNQDELEFAVQHALNAIESGQQTTPRCGPPIAGEYNPV
ncbi:MAG: hypothetical protein RL748_2137 [Pseudomonadota bacterium]|jgi:hypothetical protein